MKKISVITPCLNEKQNLIECCERVKKIFDNELKNFNYEHIIVDNNSNIETYEIIKKLTLNNKNVKALINNKNYGVSISHGNAIKFANGDAVITFLASDLQDPPEIIIEFVKKWELGYDFVTGIRKSRQEFIGMKLIRNFFYKIISYISGKKIYDRISDYQIIDKRIINEIKKIKNPNFSRIVPFDFSDNFSFVEYEWKKRVRGKSKDGIFAYISTAIIGIMFSSANPFRILLYTGIITSFLSIFYSLSVFINYFLEGPKAEPGITLIVLILLIFFSLTLLVLGFMGEYIIYIFNCLGKNRDILIKEKINFDN
jgi:glycosyltransferase involved in cell wall biosynthesis